MEKIKAFLTQKVNKNTFKDDNVKRAIKLTLCGALIVALMIQAIGCFFAPMSAYAADDDSIVGEWVLNPVQLRIGLSSLKSFDIEGSFYTASNGTSTITEQPITLFTLYGSGSYQVLGIRNQISTNNPISENILYFYDNDNNPRWVVNSTLRGHGYQFTYLPSNVPSDLLILNITGGNDVNNSLLLDYFSLNAVRADSNVHDFTGETRLFNSQLTRPPMVQADVEQYVYKFDYKVYGGYTADYFIIGRSLNEWEVAYSFIDEGSGGITTMYRQQFNQSEGRWLRPRNRLIEFITNPEDPDLQQWLLDNTVLVDNTSVGIGYDYGYDIGYNDGWTNSAIGDTLKAPVDALNGIVLLQTADVTITLGGVIFTMVVLSIMLIFLKKYAGG